MELKNFRSVLKLSQRRLARISGISCFNTVQAELGERPSDMENTLTRRFLLNGLYALPVLGRKLMTRLDLFSLSPDGELLRSRLCAEAPSPAAQHYWRHEFRQYGIARFSTLQNRLSQFFMDVAVYLPVDQQVRIRLAEELFAEFGSKIYAGPDLKMAPILAADIEQTMKQLALNKARVIR